MPKPISSHGVQTLSAEPPRPLHKPKRQTEKRESLMTYESMTDLNGVRKMVGDVVD